MACAVVWLLPALAWASEEEVPVKDVPKSYTLAYVLVVLCIVLGVFSVCRRTKVTVDED
ncbi:MAG TPA: hypothetical protein VFE24_18265 [Pirellulales bacterium]|jgi:hypothetical protein|nr:hypothetical protein [Pirellulales bacterium]